MRTHLKTITLIAGWMAAPVMAHAEKGNIMSIQQKQILATVETMTAAFHSADIEGVMTSYEDGATVVFEPGAPTSDPAVLKQMFQGAFTLDPQFTYSGHEVFIAGDIAVHFAPWSMTGTAPDGQTVEQSGLSVAVLRRQPDGRWLMVIDNPHGQNLLAN
jgi:ketosteroid isomerase-like protein